MAFLIKHDIIAVPAIIYQAENRRVKVGNTGLLIVSTADDADMVILDDGEIAAPFIYIAGFCVQVEHEKPAGAKCFIGRMKTEPNSLVDIMWLRLSKTEITAWYLCGN